MATPSTGASGPGGNKKNHKDSKEKPKWEPPVPTRIGKKKKRGPDASSRLPAVYPTTRCKLKLLKLERIQDYLLMEEEFVSSQASHSGEDRTADDRSRVDELRGSPMGVGTLEEIIDDDHAIVSQGGGSEYYVGIMSFVDKDLLEPGCSVLLHHKTHAVVGVLADDTDPMVSVMKLDKAPTESYADIGGLESQIQEIKESVELPLTHPELYEEMGIRPPKGVILYGVPGTGKTLLAKAVANQTSATFLRIVGSELIQKYLGDGPKLVRELFRVAEENSPSIVFIDEIDAIGTKRYDSTSSGEREIQRTMLELLNQLDGFDTRGDVKVIMATNRIESLDPALIRPGRIDRKIGKHYQIEDHFPLPDTKTKRHIFKLHTSRMSLADDVDLEELVMTKDELSGADIKAVCTEAGLLALRERRMRVTKVDFTSAREKILYGKDENTPAGLYL
nr:26S protease regulatory subunit 4 [Cryptococcus depauperatus CBS 7855]